MFGSGCVGWGVVWVGGCVGWVGGFRGVGRVALGGWVCYRHSLQALCWSCHNVATGATSHPIVAPVT